MASKKSFKTTIDDAISYRHYDEQESIRSIDSYLELLSSTPQVASSAERLCAFAALLRIESLVLNADNAVAMLTSVARILETAPVNADTEAAVGHVIHALEDVDLDLFPSSTVESLVRVVLLLSHHAPLGEVFTLIIDNWLLREPQCMPMLILEGMSHSAATLVAKPDDWGFLAAWLLNWLECRRKDGFTCELTREVFLFAITSDTTGGFTRALISNDALMRLVDIMFDLRTYESDEMNLLHVLLCAFLPGCPAHSREFASFIPHALCEHLYLTWRGFVGLEPRMAMVQLVAFVVDSQARAFEANHASVPIVDAPPQPWHEFALSSIEERNEFSSTPGFLRTRSVVVRDIRAVLGRSRALDSGYAFHSLLRMCYINLAVVDESCDEFLSYGETPAEVLVDYGLPFISHVASLPPIMSPRILTCINRVIDIQEAFDQLRRDDDGECERVGRRLVEILHARNDFDALMQLHSHDAHSRLATMQRASEDLALSEYDSASEPWKRERSACVVVMVLSKLRALDRTVSGTPRVEHMVRIIVEQCAYFCHGTSVPIEVEGVFRHQMLCPEIGPLLYRAGLFQHIIEYVCTQKFIYPAFAGRNVRGIMRIVLDEAVLRDGVALESQDIERVAGFYLHGFKVHTDLDLIHIFSRGNPTACGVFGITDLLLKALTASGHPIFPHHGQDIRVIIRNVFDDGIIFPPGDARFRWYEWLEYIREYARQFGLGPC